MAATVLPPPRFPVPGESHRPLRPAPSARGGRAAAQRAAAGAGVPAEGAEGDGGGVPAEEVGEDAGPFNGAAIMVNIGS